MNGLTLKEGLNKARELCPGMSEVDYLFAERIASSIQDEIVPEGFSIIVAETLYDLKNQSKQEDDKVPAEEYLNNAQFILQILDAVADKNFTEEVRKLCREAYRWKTPHMTIIKDEEEFPENVKAAIDWWSARIQRQGGTVAAGPFRLPAIVHEFTENEMRTFRSTLAHGIMDGLDKFGSVNLVVDYKPCSAELISAARAAGFEDSAIFFFPSKTKMNVRKNCVEVCSGYSGKFVVLWKKSRN